MATRGALTFSAILERANCLNDGYQVLWDKRKKQKTSVRHVARRDRATGQIGRRQDGRPMITSISVKHEGDTFPPEDINWILKALEIDRNAFWG
jgi:hypothetical protein